MAKISADQQVTDRVFAMMEEHGTDWLKPFTGGAAGGSILPVRAASQNTPYRGINVLLLWSQPYADQRWATYKGWKSLGGQVAKGQKSPTPVIFASKIESKKKTKANGKPESFFFQRLSAVFNFEQLTQESQEAIGPMGEPVRQTDDTEAIPEADAIIEATGADIVHTLQGRAFYRPSADQITMPARELFGTGKDGTPTESYYSTLFHELTHWTGHPDRLARTFGQTMGDPRYAQEELVAELGAAIMCARAGVSPEPRRDHAEYLNNWMEALQNDPTAIRKAASAAQKAVDLIDPSAQRKEETTKAA